MHIVKFVCMGLIVCLVNGFVHGQTTKPATQPSYQIQETDLAARILADNNRLVAATAARIEAQNTYSADIAKLRDVLASDFCQADADIASSRITFFLQDPSEGGKRHWSHPELFPSATCAMTVWCASDIDIIKVREFWFVLDGQGELHVLGAKPSNINWYNATEWDFPQDNDTHVSSQIIEETINNLHKKIHLAVDAYPEKSDVFYCSTILFQNERPHFTPIAWDDSRQCCYGGDTTSATSTDPPVAENGSYYGEISTINGLPRTHYINGYYRADGTYVRSYYRSR